MEMKEPASLTVGVNKTAFLLRYMKILIPVMLVLMIACFVFLPMTTAIFSAVIVMACLVLSLFLVVSGAGNAKITFLEKDETRGARVNVQAKGGTFEIFDMPACDCVIKQNEKQEKFDRGDLKFKSTQLNYIEVDNVSAVRAFLAAYFPQDAENHKTKWR